MVSRDKYEGYFFSNASLRNEVELVADLQILIPGATKDFLSKILNLYPQSDYQNVFYQRQSILGDMFINCPSKWIMDTAVQKHEGAWKLYFGAGSQLHGATAEFLFDPNYERKY
jgi:hypothetical protein